MDYNSISNLLGNIVGSEMEKILVDVCTISNGIIAKSGKSGFFSLPPSPDTCRSVSYHLTEMRIPWENL
jgi:hypothetical protein